jgi:hypothetical protein
MIMSSSKNSSSSSAANPAIIAPDSNQFVLYSLLSGGIAGSAAKTFTAPLDRVKILFQAANPLFLSYRGSMSGPFKAIYWIVKNEGFFALYRGHSATLARIFPYSSINFMCYEQYKRMLNRFSSNSSSTELPLSRFVSGSLAGLTSVACTYPLDYIHSRLTYQVGTNRYRNISHTIVQTVEEGRRESQGKGTAFPGLRALYRGFFPTMLGIIPYAGVSFFTYDTLKHIAADHNLTTIPYKLCCGAIAGAAAQSAAYPLDVIRRRMQLVGLNNNLPSNSYKSMLHAAKSIMNESGGLRGLYIGLSINYMKVGPAHAISFVTYEQAKKYFNIQPTKLH